MNDNDRDMYAKHGIKFVIELFLEWLLATFKLVMYSMPYITALLIIYSLVKFGIHLYKLH